MFQPHRQPYQTGCNPHTQPFLLRQFAMGGRCRMGNDTSSVSQLRMISVTSNLGDTRSIITHPASTTHSLSCSVNLLWVVDAGWVMILLVSPKLEVTDIILSWSMNFWARATPPLSVKVM